MTSRERVCAALSRRPVDRVPVDFGGTRQSGIAASAYHALREHLGVRPGRPVRVFDLFQMLAQVEQEVADRFGADCVGLYRPEVAFGIRNANWKPWTLFDGTPVEVPGGFHPETEPDGSLVLRQGPRLLARMPRDGFYFDRLEPYPGAVHPDLDTWEPPRLDAATLEHYPRQAAALYENTDKALVAPVGPPYELFFGLGQGGFERWMLTLVTEPDYVRALYAKLVDAWLDNLRAFHTAVGERLQVLQICDDFGTQRAPFLSERLFCELVLPAYRRGLDWVHAHTTWKIVLHSDGAIFPLLPAISEMAWTSSIRSRSTRPAWSRAGSRPLTATGWYSGAGPATRRPPSPLAVRKTSPGKRGSIWKSSAAAAGTCSRRCTTFKPACHRPTSWRCLTPHGTSGRALDSSSAARPASAPAATYRSPNHHHPARTGPSTRFT